MLLSPQPYFVERGLVTMLVPDRLRQCAVFLGIMRNGEFLPRATGFLASYEQDQFRFVHLVTAEHVVSGLLSRGEDVWLRINATNGSTGEVIVPPEVWKFHPDERSPTDVATFPLPDPGQFPDGTPVVWDHAVVALNGPSGSVATREIIQEKSIGVGEEVCVIGLFRSHYGRQKNVPIVRIGNIAMMDGEPIHTQFKGFIDGYLIEARSIGGLSGSPVFVSMPPVRVIEGHVQQTIGRQFYLLGLMHGYFDIQNLSSDVVLDDQKDATTGIHAGIGVVIPVDKIIETVEHPELTALRREYAMKERQKNGATPDLLVDQSQAAQSETAASDAGSNPRHREDFNQLVGAEWR